MSSKSKSSQSTAQSDRRIIGGDNAMSVSGDHSSVQSAGGGVLVSGSDNILNMTDSGIIAAAFDFAKQTSAAASAQMDKVFQTGGKLVESGAAMQDAAGSERKTLIIGAGVVVALVALWIMNK